MALSGMIDDEWLIRRQAFCEARIAARIDMDIHGRAGLVIAGLHRELAAIFLVQNELLPMQIHLVAAGKILRAQGLAHGLLLLGLAGAHVVLEDPLARTVIQVATRLDEHGGDDAPRVAGTDYYSPHQWLAVLQAGLLAGPADEPGQFAILIDRLRPQASVTLANGLPLGLYLDLLAPREAASSVAQTRWDDLSAVFSWRRRALRIAKNDIYHWEGTLDLAKLIDFDLLALFVCRPTDEAGGRPFWDQVIGEDALAVLPMALADRVRGFGESGPAFAH